MKRNLVLENYLNHLQEQFAEISGIILMLVLQIFLYLFLMIAASIGSSKTDKKLSKKINQLTGKDYDVRIMKGDAPGAYCFGGFTKHIFISSGLIDIMTEREVIAVCLHEASHITSYDSIKILITRMSSVSILSLLLTKLLTFIYKNNKSNLIVILPILLGLIMIFLPTLLLGKYNELKSDKSTIKYGYGRDLMSALQKLEEWVLKNQVKDSKIKMFIHKIQHLYDEHPPIQKRVKKLLNNVKLKEA